MCLLRFRVFTVTMIRHSKSPPNVLALHASGSLMLLSFLHGIMNVYLGATADALTSIYGLDAQALAGLTAFLFIGKFIGCVFGGTLIDRYGCGYIASIYSIINIFGILLFCISYNYTMFAFSMLIIGFGLSIWYPAGMVALKLHFQPRDLPYLAGLLMFFGALGSACIGIIVYSCHTYGLVYTNTLALGLSILTTIYLLSCSSINSPKTKLDTTSSLLSDFKNQILVMQNFIVIPVILSHTISAIFNYVFLPLWAIPFLSTLVSPVEAAVITSGCLVIYGVAGIVLGKAYHYFFSPLSWMSIQFCGSLLLLILLIQLPQIAINFWLVTAILFGVSTLLGANVAYTATYLANLFESKHTGTISAVYSYIFQLITALITPLYGITLATTNNSLTDYSYTLYLLLASFALSFVITLVLRKIEPLYPKILTLEY